MVICEASAICPEQHRRTRRERIRCTASTCAQKAKAADGHIDVHEELAPGLAGADGQKAEYAQCKAKPGRNQRCGMLAASAQITDQTQ